MFSEQNWVDLVVKGCFSMELRVPYTTKTKKCVFSDFLVSNTYKNHSKCTKIVLSGTEFNSAHSGMIFGLPVSILTTGSSSEKCNLKHRHANAFTFSKGKTFWAGRMSGFLQERNQTQLLLCTLLRLWINRVFHFPTV